MRAFGAPDPDFRNQDFLAPRFSTGSKGLTCRLTRAGKRRASDAAASGAAGCYAVTRTLSCKNSGAMSAPFAQTNV
jgi:hypothetical protein